MTARRGGATGRVRWWPGGAPAWSQRQFSCRERGRGAERTMMWALAADAGSAADTETRACWRCLWSVLVVALGLLSAGVSALQIITPKEIYVPYGTQGKLPCKFNSVTNSSQLTSVSWSFRPGGGHTALSFFHFSDGNSYVGNDPLFKNRVTWAGDLGNKDVSIKVQNMHYIHNGTYVCDVKNPPDIVAQPASLSVYVVENEEVPTSPTPPPPPTPMPPIWVVMGRVAAVTLGLLLFLVLLALILGKKP